MTSPHSSIKLKTDLKIIYDEKPKEEKPKEKKEIIYYYKPKEQINSYEQIQTFNR